MCVCSNKCKILFYHMIGQVMSLFGLLWNVRCNLFRKFMSALLWQLILHSAYSGKPTPLSRFITPSIFIFMITMKLVEEVGLE